MPPAKALPKYLKPYFWEYSFSNLSLKTDRDLIIRRVLTSGSWDAILWLRKKIGDNEIREWLITHHGRGLSARQLRAQELRNAKLDFVTERTAPGTLHGSMAQIRVTFLEYKYPDLSHVLYGLAYFDDAENERMPKMLWNIKWAEIKKTIPGWVKGLGK